MAETIVLETRVIPARSEETRKHGMQQFVLTSDDTLKIETDGIEWLEYSPDTDATVTIKIEISE